MVTGLILDLDKKPDQICKSYIAKKMSANLFSPCINHYCLLLALIHLDFHRPLSVTTHKGYKY